MLFAGVLVARFDEAVDWYSRFFGRGADVVAHDREVMWRVSDGGWLYVLEDADRAGRSVVTISVPDLDQAVRDLATRAIRAGDSEAVGEAGRKATTFDPDGNEVALVQMASVDG